MTTKSIAAEREREREHTGYIMYIRFHPSVYKCIYIAGVGFGSGTKTIVSSPDPPSTLRVWERDYQD